MATRNYPAIIFREEGDEAWSILFPDFPEVASSAETARDVHSEALDALRTVVDFYAEENRALPESTDIDRALDLAREQNAVAAFYGVELPAGPHAPYPHRRGGGCARNDTLGVSGGRGAEGVGLIALRVRGSYGGDL